MSNSANTVVVVSKRTVDAEAQVLFSLQDSAGFHTVMYYNAAGQVVWRSGTGLITGNGVPTTDFNISIGTYDGGSNVSLYNNGVKIQGGTNGALNPNVDRAAIGASTSALELTGSIAEILTLPFELTNVEREKIEGYLAHKYGIQSSLVDGHTYKTLIPALNESRDFGFDVIALMGQSNMVGSYGPIDPVLDAADSRILQWGRTSPTDQQIILAEHPLQHNSPPADTIGLGLNFAKNHLASMTSSTRRILLVPIAKGGTGFGNNEWNPGDALYEGGLSRLNAAIAERTGNQLTHILWHQGEADSAMNETQYAAALDTMLSDLRSRATGAANVPFICGGILPGITSDGVRNALIDTPNRNANSYYVDPTALTLGVDNLHFDAPSLREFGDRYWNILSA